MKQNNSKIRPTKPLSKVGLIGAANEPESLDDLRIEGVKERTAYSGGFKMPDGRSTQPAIVQQPSLQTRPDKDTILKQLGVTNQSSVDQRMAGVLPSSKADLQDKLVDSIEVKLERIRFERAKLLESGLSKLKVDAQPSAGNPNVLKIHESKERSQVAYQQPSSLDAMTLENIQAQLEAHRIGLKPLEQRFFEKRGRSPPANLLTTGQQVEADKKLLIYAIKQPQISQSAEKKGIDEDELQRLFQERKKNDPKLAEYDAKFKEYEVEKLARKAINKSVRETLFRSDWDKYKQSDTTKSKKKLNSLSKDKQKASGADQAPAQAKMCKSPQKKLEDERIDFLQEKYSLEKIVLSKNDRYITKYIFKQLDPNRHGIISKEELFEYCMEQEIIRKDFNIDEKWFYSDLDTFPTKRKGILEEEECLEFLSVQRMLKHPTIELVDPNQKAADKKKVGRKPGLQLSENQLKIIEEVFKSLDPHDDRLVKRQELIDSLYMDPEVATMLDLPAVEIEVIGKSISLRQILELVLSEYRSERNPKSKKAKQYITLNQFMDFFKQWEGLQVSNLRPQAKSKTAESELFDVYPDYLQLLLDTFNSVPRVYQDYICTKDFLEVCRTDPQIQALGEELCRIDSIETGLKLENIGMVLKRMYLETDEYACWNELKQYFSRRGRPIDWNLSEINLRKEIRQKKIAEAETKLSTTQSRIKKKYDTQKSYGLDVRAETLKQAASSVVHGGKYTVPDPFPITDIIRPKGAVPNAEGHKEFDALKQGIKALPLNKEILEPKMDKLEKQREERSKQIREQSKKRTAETEKPFSFYEKEVIARVLKEASIKQVLKRKLEDQEKNAVHAAEIGVSNLKKPYNEVIKEEQEKRKTKKPTTEFQVSDSLYPKNPTQIEIEKAKKVEQKMEKLEQVEVRRKQELERVKKTKQQQNKKKDEVLREKKKRDEEQQKEKDAISKKAAGATFKPQINQKFQPDSNREDTKKKRQEKENERILQFMKEQEDKRRKIREFQPKQEPKPSIEELDDEELLDKLSDIDFEDIIDEEQLKAEYLRMKDFESIPFANRRKLNKERRHAMMNRERKEMQAEQKRRRQQIIQLNNQQRKKREQSRQKIATGQLDRTKDKKIDVRANEFEGGFNFHRSRALRRYRDLMDGKAPLSEYDRMSNQPSMRPQDPQQQAEQFSSVSNSTIKEQ